MAATPARSLSLEQSILTMVSAGAPNLTITEVLADDERHDLLWVTWKQGTAGNAHTWLMFLRREHGVAIPVRRTDRPETYQPSLRSIPPWSFGGSVVVMLQFQYGAAYTRAEV